MNGSDTITLGAFVVVALGWLAAQIVRARRHHDLVIALSRTAAALEKFNALTFPEAD